MWPWRSKSLSDNGKPVVQRDLLETDMSPQVRFDLRLAELAYARHHHGGFLPGGFLMGL